ncbi:hypothetical protein PVAR5_1209 [Paecilomyces variotii No. 5]|uniref:Uncharacterized protein n=1 Tax=Byssochlamys spectabilis (strain No. 5 / NBRC 109023) TaxID=1356009 RepID=V5FSF9_BYSSN|nr:hypothetical protein PVAR5_1209 [Paecilomyces variotii No. 5]
MPLIYWSHLKQSGDEIAKRDSVDETETGNFSVGPLQIASTERKDQFESIIALLIEAVFKVKGMDYRADPNKYRMLQSCLKPGAHGCIQRVPRAPGRVPGRAPWLHSLPPEHTNRTPACQHPGCFIALDGSIGCSQRNVAQMHHTGSAAGIVSGGQRPGCKHTTELA